MTLRISSPLSDLATRLGYDPEDRLLIVNCDDLGSSHSANVATYRAMVSGLATSATLMVPCPWAREAARMFAGLPVGVHLTLTSEHRGYRWRGLTNGTSLRDEEGFFPATSKAALERIDPEEARAECRAQIGAAISWGVDVTHLDAHMNVMQARTDLYGIYLDLAVEFRLRCGCSRGRSRRNRALRPVSAPRPAVCCSTSTSSIHGPGALGTCSSKKSRSYRQA